MATIDDVRRIALSLPDVTEKPWFNSPGFRVKDKSFLRVRTEAEGALVVFLESLEDKDALLASDPTVLVHLEAIDVAELTELIVDAWRVKAPARVRKAHDHELPG